jgi:SAM-dependent methyltransferase
VQGDAQLLPLGTASVDVIFNLESAFHYPDKDAFLRGCRRVLKPGGYLLIGDLAAPKPLFPFLCRSQCAHFWSPEQYHRAVTELGFKHVTIEDVTPRVLESIRRSLGQLFRTSIRHWWSSRHSVFGVCGAWFLLRRRRLRYLLIRAEA